jgi:hypothetical protein
MAGFSVALLRKLPGRADAQVIRHDGFHMRYN